MLPPYGVKEGIFYILLTAFILANKESISLYLDDIFIPTLTMENLELMFRKPKRFRIKKIIVNHVNQRLLQSLGKKLDYSFSTKGLQNYSLINAIKPLLKTVRDLPYYSKNTQNLSQKAIQLRSLLEKAKEPDTLMFQDIPLILNISIKKKY